MSETAILVKNVSKKYRLFNSPQDRLKEALHPFSKHYHREFWALREISFEIPRGQTVGILGRNGSGKSTLLQIIAGIMQPTSGEVIVNGRISALLELGAGFNPEFTGRENAIFQAEVMGLRRDEIDRKIIEIESFADIGEFFDQPVKIYSSGMFVRVAFAAAIHCDPAILIIDEAMAVGDSEFQVKCYQKIDEFKSAGRTIILVTHDHEAVNRHCDHAILLERGRVVADGDPMKVIGAYLDLIEGRSTSITSLGSPPGSCATVHQGNAVDLASGAVENFLQHHEASFASRNSYSRSEICQKSDRAEIIDYLIISDGVVYPNFIQSSCVIDLYIAVKFHDKITRPAFGISARNKEGIMIYALNSALSGTVLPPAIPDSIWAIKFEIPLPLAGGDVFFDIGVDEMTGQSSDYKNICRKISCIKLSIISDKTIFGLVDLSANFEFISSLT